MDKIEYPFGKIGYSFEEFLRHFDEIEPFLEKERKSERAPKGRDDEPFPWEWKHHRVAALINAKYPDWETRKAIVPKISLYLSIMTYLSGNLAAFDIDDLAVFGSTKVGGLVSEQVVRAIHHFFTSGSPPNYDPTPDEVIALAKTFGE